MLCLMKIGLSLLVACLLAPWGISASGATLDLDEGWENPPIQSRLRAYWWWLNGNVTRESITRDLEEMKAKGFGGALICDAGGAEQDGNATVPHGPTFFSPEWRELYKHTLREGDRLGLELSLNILSGWNLGGPMISADDAAKKLVWSETEVQGPSHYTQLLPTPKKRDSYYRDLFAVGYRVKTDADLKPNTAKRSLSAGASSETNKVSSPRPIQLWEQKAFHKALSFSAPDTNPLLQDVPSEPGEEETHSSEVVDLTSNMTTNGVLNWDVPKGSWKILRFGCTVGDHAYVSTSSDGWKGYAVDALDKPAFQRYWDAVVEPLIADAGPLAGKSLKYLHTDSWEVEAVNWTPSFRAEFKKRRGYDFLKFLPVITGRIVDSRPVSNRFLDDFRRTLGDLAAENHYGLFLTNAHKHGLLIHPESGGPHAVPIDAQQCLGWNDMPMSEFWAWSWRHRVGDSNRFFVKQPASAAHTYGKPYVAAEGFTTIGPHWQETIWDNLKPAFDKALCEGLNLLVWHAFVCSPKEMGIPGQQYFAGTHFNPNTTWWPKSQAFLGYINRCQWMLQQGLFSADVCYYYGDHVPNFAQLKSSDPARILPGYDYDVISAEALITRMSIKGGRLVLPDGMSYRLLVLPDRTMISLPVLRKIKALVEAGATVIGPKPATASGLQDYPLSDKEVTKLAAELWGSTDGKTVTEHVFGKGKVITGKTAREVLLSRNVQPDFEVTGVKTNGIVDYIHRSNRGTEIYFVANRSNRWESFRCAFRVAGKTPEIWDPVTGTHHDAKAWEEKDGRTWLPLDLPPCGSLFIVFKESSSLRAPTAETNTVKQDVCSEFAGSWTVHFDPAWGGPASIEFDHLIPWNMHANPGVRYYSGAATYQKTFDAPTNFIAKNHQLILDIGNVRELAEVKLNGKSMGIAWTPPFQVDLTSALKPAGNLLEIEVVNFWPNRIIGDQSLPEKERFTQTNIRKLAKETALMESGLLGPVRLMQQPTEPRQDKAELTLDRIFTRNEFKTEEGESVHWLKNETTYTKLQDSATVKNGKDIVRCDPESGKQEILVSASSLIPPGEENPVAMESCTWSEDMGKLLIFNNSRRVWRTNSRGDYWLWDRQAKKLKKLGGNAPASSMMFASFSQDGKRVAYVSKNNLFVQDIESLRITQLTSSGSSNIINGTSDWVYEEEFYLRNGFKWSPDGKYIAYWQFDTSQVPLYQIINNTDAPYPKTSSFPYPKVGQTNSACRVGIVHASGGSTRWIETNRDPRNHYIPEMFWTPDSKSIVLQQLNRLQNTNQVIRVEAATGKTNIVLEERDEAWVDVDTGWHWLNKGSRFLWFSERDGWRHLYSVSYPSGQPLLLTPGNWDVVSITGLDEKNGNVYFIASPENPTQRYLYQVDLNGQQPPKRITPDNLPGWHDYQASKDCLYATHTYSQFGKPPSTDLVQLPEHKIIKKLSENKKLQAKLDALKPSDQQFFKVNVGDGVELDGWCIRPPDFNPDKKYPVLFQVYGEPAGQTATDHWGGDTYLWHRIAGPAWVPGDQHRQPWHGIPQGTHMAQMHLQTGWDSGPGGSGRSRSPACQRTPVYRCQPHCNLGMERRRFNDIERHTAISRSLPHCDGHCIHQQPAVLRLDLSGAVYGAAGLKPRRLQRRFSCKSCCQTQRKPPAGSWHRRRQLPLPKL